MNVEINSVWQIEGIEGIEDGLYRCLRILHKIGSFVFFGLEGPTKILKPVLIPVDIFLTSIEVGETKKSSYPLPFFVLFSDSEISAASKKERDRRYNFISTLIDSDLFYLEYCTKKRTKFLSAHAKAKGVSVQTLYRLLNKYWLYGQDRAALLSADAAKGARGKVRSANTDKRGRAPRSKSNAIELYKGINITTEHQEKIRKGLKKFYLRKDGEKTLKKAYEKTLIEYYPLDIERAAIANDYAQVPTYRQFLYWKTKLVKPEDLIRTRTTDNDYAKNKRALLGCVGQEALLPGDCFEIDATVLDVHVVASLNRNKTIGRPTLYMVIDKASRMIVGLHVSMEYASWHAARQALVNSFLPKVAYCQKYNVKITEHEWPCKHIPKKLLCDRGEMVCADAEDLVVPLMELAIAAPYRADMKGVVERRFKIVNDELLHSLIGTTEGKQYVRGDADPRQQAMYTLDEVTEMLIREVLAHNQSMFDDLATSSKLLVENDLYPSPTNYWNIHLLKHKHSLKVEEESEIRAKLLPKTMVSVTKYGIECNELYYSCEKMVKENWAAVARAEGRWQLEGRVDRDNSSFIYVKVDDNEGFVRCDLLPRSTMFKNLPLADLYYFQDWKKSKKQLAVVTMDDVYAHKRKKEIDNKAKKEQQESPKNKLKSDKITDMRERRRQAIIDERNEIKDNKLIQQDAGGATTFVSIDAGIDAKMIAMLKRKQKAGDNEAN